jgi:predicted dehydrogenase
MSFKVCVIGCGQIADTMHGPAYVKYRNENNDIEFAGCCDIDEAKAEMFRLKYSFTKSYTDWNKMLTVEKPDAVCLLTPVQFIAPMAEKILSYGIPLLIEKPPGRTKDELLKLINIAEQKNVPHLVAFNRRYAPLIRKTRELAQTGITSPEQFQSLRYEMHRVKRHNEDFSTTAIHAIDTVRYICGSDYKNISFNYLKHSELENVLTGIHLSCTMKSGALVHLHISTMTGINSEGCTVCLDDKTIILDYLGNPINTNGRLTCITENVITLDVTGIDTQNSTEDNDVSEMQFEREGFYYENKIFFDNVISGKMSCSSLQDSLQSIEVSEYIRERKREVTF